MKRPMRTFRSKYGVGDVVYLLLRTDRVPGRVTSVICGGAVSYSVSWCDGSGESVHQEFELGDEFTPDFGEDVAD